MKKSKELDDNNPNKNDRKVPKTIAALVNEGYFSYLYIPTGVYAEIRSLFEFAVPNAGGDYEDQEPDCQMVCHLVP